MAIGARTIAFAEGNIPALLRRSLRRLIHQLLLTR